MTDKELYSEKMFVGYNLYGIGRRLILVLACLCIAWFGEDGLRPGSALVLLSAIIAGTSILLLFVPFYRFSISSTHFSLQPMFRKKIQIPLQVIEKTETATDFYSRFTNPMFNVREMAESAIYEGEVHFYVHGRHALVLHLEGGNTFVIGLRYPQKAAGMLEQALRSS
jgi:hypothetical protein